jgi:nucleotide-binding universal stress UspA family protein
MPASFAEPAVPLPPDMRSGPIVVGVDDAVACGRPLRAAAFLARAAGRPVVLLHVRRRTMPLVEGYLPVPDEYAEQDEVQDGLEAELAAAVRASGDLEGLAWELVSCSGEPGAELVRLAQERDAACVVVGKRHRGFGEFLHRVAAGSVSRAVVATQQFPVLIVP